LATLFQTHLVTLTVCLHPVISTVLKTEQEKAMIPLSRTRIGCQMVHFQTKNLSLGKFLKRKMLLNSLAFGITYSHLVRIMEIR
jgi:hypothetical protein